MVYHERGIARLSQPGASICHQNRMNAWVKLGLGKWRLRLSRVEAGTWQIGMHNIRRPVINTGRLDKPGCAGIAWLRVGRLRILSPVPIPSSLRPYRVRVPRVGRLAWRGRTGLADPLHFQGLAGSQGHTPYIYT